MNLSESYENSELEMLNHCRFCAEKCEELIHIVNDSETYNHCIEMLTFLQINYIDLRDSKLPKYICIECFHSLYRSYNFLKKVKESQLIINSIYNELSVKQETEDSDYEEVSEYLQDAEDTVKLEKAIESTSVPHNTDKLIGTKVGTSSERGSSSNLTYNDVPLDMDNIIGTTAQIAKCFNKDDNISNSWNNYKWQCCHCYKYFGNMDELRLHSKENHNICHGFNCVDCIDEFNTFNAFVEHVRRHRQGLRYYCQYCNKSFIREADCLDHTIGHWNGTNMICDLCGEIFPDQSSFERHKGLYKKRKLHRRMSRKPPIQVEPENQPRWKTWDSYDWTCLDCNLKVPNIGMLREHIQKIHKKCFAMKCVDCLRVMMNFRLFTAHVATHRPHLQKICQYCNVFIEGETLDLHIKKHFSGPQKPCEGCGQIFENNEVLKQHLKQFDPPRRLGKLTKEDLTCDECNKSFSTMGSLRKHRKSMHNPKLEREHTCDVCGKAFYNDTMLRTHKILHEKKTVTCDICKMMFHTKYSLKYHIMTHSDARPFKCEQCNKFFRTKKRLDCHGLSHTDIKKYLCIVCDKKFKHYGTLKNHMNQHTGLRPYACPMCEKTFTNHSNRLKHVQRIHGTKDIKKK